MAREFFKNLPNTTTPLTAPRLNGLLDGDEAMGNLKVDSIRTKNLLGIPNRTVSANNIITSINDGRVSISGTYSQSTSFTIKITPITLQSGKTYTFSKNQSNSGHYPYCILRDANGNDIISTTYSDSIITYTPSNNITLTALGFYVGGNDAISSSLYLQLEEGNTNTTYSQHKDVEYTSGDTGNGYYIKYDDGTLIQWGNIAKSSFQTSSDLKTAVQGINVYRSNNPGVIFPYSFVDTNYTVSLSVHNGTSGTRLLVTRTLRSTASGFEAQLMALEPFYNNGTAYSNLTDVTWYAIGRWK